MAFSKRNNALNLNDNTVNGRTADIHITTHGSILYFAISAALGVAGFIFLLLSMFRPRRNRLFHYITAAIVWTAAIAYFTMGSNLGFTPIAVEFVRGRPVVRGRYREIFYVRYIDWVLTTPLLLLDLLLTAGLPWPKILFVLFVDEVMIVMGLTGALVQSRYKFAYFAIGCFALLYILYELIWTARRHAATLGPDVHRTFLMCGCLTLLLWIAYPIAWGLCEGGNYIAPDSEAIFYSVLDFCAKIVFGALLLCGHRNIDPARLGVAIREYGEDPGTHRGLHGLGDGAEKERAGQPSVSSDGTRVGSAPGTTQTSGPALASGSHAKPPGGPEQGEGTVTAAAPGIAAPASETNWPMPPSDGPPATAPKPGPAQPAGRTISEKEEPMEPASGKPGATTGTSAPKSPLSNKWKAPHSTLPIPSQKDVDSHAHAVISAARKSGTKPPLPIPGWENKTANEPASALKEASPSYLPTPANVTAAPIPFSSSAEQTQSSSSTGPGASVRKTATRSSYIPKPVGGEDTTGKDNADVDGAGTKGKGSRERAETLKTYADAIRLAGRGETVGGNHSA